MARPDNRGSSRPQLGWAKVWLPLRVRRDLCFKSFILPTPDVLQVGPFRTSGGLFVQINRDIQFPANALGQMARHLHTLFHTYSGNRHERHHIRGAKARVGTAMLVKVDQPGGRLNRPERRFFHCRGRPGVGDHAAVVVSVGTGVKQGNFSHPGDGGQDCFNYFRAPGF